MMATRDVYVDNVLREKWDDTGRTFTAFSVTGVQTSSRPYTAAESAAADSQAASATAATNGATLRDKAAAAVNANLAWTQNSLPQIVAGADAIQGRTQPAAPTTIAQVNAVLNTLWTDVRNLSLAVESLANERGRSVQIENALIRLVIGALDSTDGT